MRSLQYDGAGQISIRDVPDPIPGAGDALVRIIASAVCGSERGALSSGLRGNAGHEASGFVLDPGSSCFAPGDRVGLTAVVGCGTCDRCAAGEELHCRQGPASSTASGGWHAELAAVPSSALRALPASVDMVEGALMSGDPLGVPARASHRFPTPAGARVLVIGAGPVGLSHVLLRSFERADVTVVEPSQYRRELAVSLGASSSLDTSTEIVERPSLVIECSGHPDSIRMALSVVEDGGVVMQSGECHQDISINPSELMIRREVTYAGCWYYSSSDYPRMCELVGRGLPLRKLCTHVNEVGTGTQAVFSEFLEGQTGKVVLRWG